MKKQKIIIIILLLLSALHVDAQSKRALLIGISEYPEINIPYMSWNDIHGVDKQTLKKLKL